MWEFTKDGEMVLTPSPGKGFSMVSKYTVERDILTPATIAMTFAAGGASKIKTLNQTDLVLEDDGMNHTIELKRKK